MTLLARLLTFSLRHPLLVAGIYLVVGILCWRMVAQIEVDTDIANLLPDENPHVQTMERITRLLGSEDRVEIIFPASYSGWQDDAEAFGAEMLAMRRANAPLYSGFELYNDTRVLRENVLYVLTPGELDALEDRLRSEQERLRLRANPFFVEFDEEASGTDHDFPLPIALEIPPDLFLSRDSLWVLMRFSPAGAKSDIGFVEEIFARTDSLIQAFAPRLPMQNPEILYGGNLYHHITKFRDIQATLNVAVVVGVGSILLFLMLYSVRLGQRYLRGSGSGLPVGLGWMMAWSVAVVIIILLPLSVALLITYASGFLLFANLNIMTTVLIAILLGVTLDYVLHFFSTYMRNRASMRDIRALMETFFDCGKALLISCLTSGLAMLVLLFSGFRGFFEFGALFFAGIMSTYLLTITLFAVLVIALDRAMVRLSGRQGVARVKSESRATHGPLAETLQRRARPLFFGVAIVLVAALFFLPRISFEYAFNKLEPRPDTDTRFNEVRATFESGTRNDAAFFLFDTREQAIQAATQLSDTTRFLTIGHIERIHDRFPQTPSEQRERLGRIAEIRMLLEDPLLAEAIESITAGSSDDYPMMSVRNHRSTATDNDRPRQNGQSSVQAGNRDALRDSIPIDLLTMLQTASRQTEPLSLEDMPVALRQRFMTTEGNLANLVIIYPDMMLADGRESIRFKEDAAVVVMDGRPWYAASTAIIGAGILQIMQTEARWLMIAPLLACLICLMIFFRSWKWGLLAFAPLLASLLLLIGIMAALGMKFNIYNIIVLPAVLGVGADNGIHLFHQLRLMREGRGAGSFASVLGGTGTFITASSFTTTLGFAGLLFTGHPGLQSMGIVAVGGILLSLVCAVAATGYVAARKAPY